MQKCAGKEAWDPPPPQLGPVPLSAPILRPQADPHYPLVLSKLVGSPACPVESWGAGMLEMENGRGRRAFSTVEPMCVEGRSWHPSGC